jgi:hypothetical protein
MKIAYSLEKNDIRSKKELGLEIVDRDFSKSELITKYIK